MKIKWTQNWGLKIGSFVFAAILWLLVTSINDPVDHVPYNNIPVRLLHANELLTAEDKVYEVLDGTDVISEVTIWAPRSVLGKISSSNIVATADLSNLSSLDTVRIDLSVNNVNTSDISNITGTIDILKLNIEEKIDKSLQIRAATSGNLEEGYIIGDISTEQNYVSISGPKSLIDRVTSAAASTSVDGANGDINTQVEVKLFDADGKQVSSNRMEQNIRTVGVQISVLETKAVPVGYTVTGIPAAGYRHTGEVEVSSESIELAAKSSVIRKIGRIEIPETVLDVAGSTENYIKTVDIEQYLPEGSRLTEDQTDQVTITVMIEPEVTKTVTVRESRVRIVNMPDGFEGSFSGMDDEVTVTLIGLQRDLDLIRETEMRCEIDIEQLMADREMEEIASGFYTVDVDLNLGNQITILEPIEVMLHVTAMED